MKNVTKLFQIFTLMVLSFNLAFAAKDPISVVASNAFPSPIFVDGGSHQVTYTLKNNLPFQLVRPLELDKITSPVDEFTYLDTCTNNLLRPQEECTLTVYLNPLVAGLKTFQLIVGNQGFFDNNRVPFPINSTIATGQTGIGIVGHVVTPLPTTLPIGQSAPYAVEFENLGTSQATGVSIQSSNTSFTTTCTTQLDASSVCMVSGTYTATTALPVQQAVDTTFNYTQGASVTESTSTAVTTASGGIVATTPILLPTQMVVGTTKPVLFLFTNQSSSPITITSRDLAGPSAGTFTVTSPTNANDNCAGITLSPGQACQLNGTYTAPGSIPSTADVSMTETVHYLAENSTPATTTASTSTTIVTTITNQRTMTFTNQCNFPVWFSLNGSAIPNSPNCPTTACPDGSTCNTGSHLCYWNNASPSTGSYALTTTDAGRTATVDIIGSLATGSSDTLWSGNFSASTLCSGSSCGQAACGNHGGTTSCAPGVGFNQPATQAEITMLTVESSGTDTYDVEVINGFHIPIKMTPNQTANNYSCGVPGNEVAANNFGACDWTNANPLNSNSSPVNKYFWVTSTGTACLSGNTCATSGEKCGLDIDLNPVCGDFLGYFSANQLCAINSKFTSPFGDGFSCSQNLNSPFPASTYPLSQLLACPVPAGSTGPLFNSGYLNYTSGVYTSTELTQVCGCVNWWDVAGIAANSNNNDPTFICQSSNSSNAGATLQVDPQWTSLVQPTIQWMKQACPSAYTYPFDDKSSTFTCTQPDYTVTFCPGGDTGLPTGLTEGRG